MIARHDDLDDEIYFLFSIFKSNVSDFCHQISTTHEMHSIVEICVFNACDVNEGINIACISQLMRQLGISINWTNLFSKVKKSFNVLKMGIKKVNRQLISRAPSDKKHNHNVHSILARLFFIDSQCAKSSINNHLYSLFNRSQEHLNCRNSIALKR